MKNSGFSIILLCLTLGACGQAEVPTAAPFAPSLIEDNLLGKVRKIVTEPVLLGGQPSTKGAFLFIEGYNPDGFSIKFGYAKRVGNEVVEQSAFERTLDKTGRLLSTSADDKKVSYQYEKYGEIVRALPVDADGKTIEAETFYEQRTVGDNVAITESTLEDGVASVRTYSPSGKLLSRVQFNTYSKTKTETAFLDGRIQSETATKNYSEQNPKVTVAKYVYGEGQLPQRILRYENDALVATEEYEYKLDTTGNWIEYSMYKTEPNKGRVLFNREQRVIEYYP